MSDDKSSNKWGTTKCKKFSGMYKEYSEWKEKFEALEEIKGFSKYYKSDVKTVSKEESESGTKSDGSNVSKKEKLEQKSKQKA